MIKPDDFTAGLDLGFRIAARYNLDFCIANETLWNSKYGNYESRDATAEECQMWYEFIPKYNTQLINDSSRNLKYVPIDPIFDEFEHSMKPHTKCFLNESDFNMLSKFVGLTEKQLNNMEFQKAEIYKSPKLPMGYFISNPKYFNQKNIDKVIDLERYLMKPDNDESDNEYIQKCRAELEMKPLIRI